MKNPTTHPLVRLVMFTLGTILATGTLGAHADLEQSLKDAMASPDRPEADKVRDKNRLPVETLKFFGLTEDMKILELLPGGGWYTRLLAPALAEKGELYVALGTQGIEAQQKAGNFSSVKVLPVDMSKFSRPEGSQRFANPEFKVGEKNFDMVLTFRNLHNIDEPSRAVMNKEVFRVLKKGGTYGVVDHTRRHMQADNQENWRRMDPVQMIKEIESVGFEFVDYSDLHYRMDDELQYEVGRRSVSGNTDRFTLLFKKPK